MIPWSSGAAAWERHPLAPAALLSGVRSLESLSWPLGLLCHLLTSMESLNKPLQEWHPRYTPCQLLLLPRFLGKKWETQDRRLLPNFNLSAGEPDFEGLFWNIPPFLFPTIDPR